MEAMIHKKPNIWKTFAPHCVKAYVLGTSPKHYHCWQLWLKEIGTPIISGKVFFKRKYITNPMSTPEDDIMDAAENFALALKGKIPPHLQ